MLNKIFKFIRSIMYSMIIIGIAAFILICIYAIQLKEIEIKEESNKLQTDEEYVDVWTTKEVSIKNEPNMNSESIGVYYWNTKIPVTFTDDAWAKIKGVEYYLDRKYISDIPISFVDREAPSNNTIKSYMDYRTITLTSSNQYKLQKSLAYTGDCGIRMVGDRYCVALGSYYTTIIGQYVDIELENGVIIKGILADCKADIHTDSTNRINPNGSVLEFVVDNNYLDRTAMKMGDLSYVKDWNSKVVNIRVYDNVEDF